MISSAARWSRVQEQAASLIGALSRPSGRLSPIEQKTLKNILAGMKLALQSAKGREETTRENTLLYRDFFEYTKLAMESTAEQLDTVSDPSISDRNASLWNLNTENDMLNTQLNRDFPILQAGELKFHVGRLLGSQDQSMNSGDVAGQKKPGTTSTTTGSSSSSNVNQVSSFFDEAVDRLLATMNWTCVQSRRHVIETFLLEASTSPTLLKKRAASSTAAQRHAIDDKPITEHQLNRMSVGVHPDHLLLYQHSDQIYHGLVDYLVTPHYKPQDIDLKKDVASRALCAIQFISLPEHDAGVPSLLTEPNTLAQSLVRAQLCANQDSIPSPKYSHMEGIMQMERGNPYFPLLRPINFCSTDGLRWQFFRCVPSTLLQLYNYRASLIDGTCDTFTNSANPLLLHEVNGEQAIDQLVTQLIPDPENNQTEQAVYQNWMNRLIKESMFTSKYYDLQFKKLQQPPKDKNQFQQEVLNTFGKDYPLELFSRKRMDQFCESLDMTSNQPVHLYQSPVYNVANDEGPLILNILKWWIRGLTPVDSSGRATCWELNKDLIKH